MKIKLTSLFISKKSGLDWDRGRKWCWQENIQQNSKFSGFCRRTVNHQPNDSLAFQQHASGHLSAIKLCLGVVCDIRTYPTLCKLAIVMGFLLPQIYWVVVFKPARLLNVAADELAPGLAYLFQNFVDSGKIPWIGSQRLPHQYSR